MKNTHVVSIRCDDLLISKLAAFAAERDWTIAHAVRKILMDHFFPGSPASPTEEVQE